MFADKPRGIAFRIRRQHRLNKETVDSMPWPHPRPASDPRLVGIHLALIWTASGSAILGPPENTVQGRAFGWAATIVFGIAMVLFCGMYLFAAYCKSQYESFGYEMAACIGFAGSLSIYAYLLMISTPNWALTYNWPVTIGLALGNAIRAWVLIRRFW